MENLNNPYNKYHNGKIYKITDVAYTECYIGSTVQPLCNRMAEHRRHYQQYKRGTKAMEYTSFRLFDKYGVEHCKIELIEAYRCESKDELVQREGYWIRLEENCLNKQVAGRSRKEYTLETKDMKREYDKNYRKQNIEKIKKYRQDNKERISEYNKQYLVNYYKENKESALEKHKSYYLQNREKVKARQSVRVVCPTCNKSLCKSNLLRHQRLMHPQSDVEHAIENNK